MLTERLWNETLIWVSIVVFMITVPLYKLSNHKNRTLNKVEGFDKTIYYSYTFLVISSCTTQLATWMCMVWAYLHSYVCNDH